MSFQRIIYGSKLAIIVYSTVFFRGETYMEKKLLLTLTIMFLTSCGEVSSLDILNTKDDPALIDEATYEYGTNQSDEITEKEDGVNTCALFENPIYEGVRFSEMFPRKYARCEDLNDDIEIALMAAYDFSDSLLYNINSFDRVNLCKKILKRSVRKILNYHRREQRIINEDVNSRLLAKRNSLTRSRIDRNIRKLIHYNCLSSFGQDLTYSYNGETEIYSLDTNYIINSKFELVKHNLDDIKGTSTIEDGWVILDSTNVPGWRVKEVNPSGEEKNCSFLEIQSDGHIVNTEAGGSIVELDSQCKNSSGNNIRGDANVEIFQRFPVQDAGIYSASVKAQKRSGKYGNLEISLFQKRSKKEFLLHELPNIAEWNTVCQEILITNPQKYVTVSIRDIGNDGRETFGILLDEVKFKKGPCVIDNSN
jgi:hypothetical protein